MTNTILILILSTLSLSLQLNITFNTDGNNYTIYNNGTMSNFFQYIPQNLRIQRRIRQKLFPSYPLPFFYALSFIIKIASPRSATPAQNASSSIPSG